MLDTIFNLMLAWKAAHPGKHPKVLRVCYLDDLWLRRLLKAEAGDSILPIVGPPNVPTPFIVFGMWITPDYWPGPWLWIEEP